jgi:transposase
MAVPVKNAGIDVGKETLEVAVLGKTIARYQTKREADGLARLVEWLHQHNVVRIGLEASGGYEREVLDTLQDAGFIIAQLNPRQVRRFAQAKGRLAKNDKADARLIAEFMAKMVETDPAPRDRSFDRLIEHLTVRRRLRDWINDCTNLLEHLRNRAARRVIQVKATTFKAALRQQDKAIATLIAEHPQGSDTERRLRTVPGVGPVLAATLIAMLPELGTLSRQAVAALVGVAPFDDDSGKRSGARVIEGGRKSVRHALYMAALSATIHNPVVAAFAKRLSGKKPKVILVACMRKLIVILNAMMRDKRDWDPARQITAAS